MSEEGVVETTHSTDVKSDQYLAVSYARAREELEAVLSDPQFQCSERNKKFLRFVSEELFAGRESALKAYSIAVDVFGRPPSFDASTDPIVRIEATRLRSALARYYELYGPNREVSIELPKGRYVPVFSRHVQEATNWGDHPSGMQLHPRLATVAASNRRPTLGLKTIVALKKIGLAGAALLGVATFAGFHLLSGLNSTTISERPSLSIDLALDGSNDSEAVALRDSLMTALSSFSSLRLSTPDIYTSSTTEDASVAPDQSQYRLILKYRSDKTEKSVWWQVVDQQTGEALHSDDEHIGSDTVSSIDPAELLVSRLAARIASSNGVINTVEGAQDLENPTLGNGCVLRANLALSMQTVQALQQARQCLERTLEQRPYDADAHAMLVPILLSIDPLGAPTGLTVAAHEHADRAVALAPRSSRSFGAKMIAEFRIGHMEAAISAGRRAMALNPYDTKVAAKFARILYSTGERSEGLRLARKAEEFDGTPLADAELTLALDAYRQKQFGEVLLRLRQATHRECYLADLLLAATLWRLGREEEASAMVSHIRRTRPDFERNFQSDMSSRRLDPQMRAELAQGLQLVGLRLQ
ncbi:hypothetical protein [Mesorhizobium sp. M6A.T.Ce.TU.016.01.1.1]|uniref:tetratricopeptide repeat protein n=1 Tax=Mesorhizobium sp. M6A.T.Ce.TU.016.01.1.1 TaxID=2496783 RepID=UPI000FCA0B1D|nr:hypothetical protein [Mesorhizobium sp. M6A.T.Ce.TU.016.01.1.1]RUU28326.1 hypothetical protein EOC94_17855 [Mesorhizobium sp. M6A.T.Ce.TU.016.01.1.1]